MRYKTVDSCIGDMIRAQFDDDKEAKDILSAITKLTKAKTIKDVYNVFINSLCCLQPSLSDKLVGNEDLGEVIITAYDLIVQNYGVEYIGFEGNKRAGTLFSNTGDTYKMTMLYERQTDKIFFSSVGDYADKIEYSGRFKVL